jgi:uncharacterized membrane protein
MAVKQHQVICKISGKIISDDKASQGFTIRDELFDIIQRKCPDFTTEDWISEDELDKIKLQRIKEIIAQDKGYVGEIEAKIIDAVSHHDFMSRDFTEEEEESLTFGQKLADIVAEFGGSWKFIISFSGFIFLWIILNSFVLLSNAFDPHPFILLNLILSCVAALQAPVIMMSQNRAEEKDRKRAINDFKVGLKTEIEIRILDEKINHIINNQISHLHETLDVQNEMIAKILKNTEKIKNNQNK